MLISREIVFILYDLLADFCEKLSLEPFTRHTENHVAYDIGFNVFGISLFGPKYFLKKRSCLQTHCMMVITHLVMIHLL